jgi:predicted nucleic acid-binding protein
MAIDRLEDAGIRSLADLRTVGVDETVNCICRRLGSAGCQALAESATLVTHNTREFQRVRKLRVEDWVAPD